MWFMLAIHMTVSLPADPQCSWKQSFTYVGGRLYFVGHGAVAELTRWLGKKNLVYENQGSVWFVEIVLLGEWTFFSGLMKTYNFMNPCVECMSSVKGVWLFKSPQKYCYTILFEQCFHPCVKSLSSIMLTTLQDPNSYMVISKVFLAAFYTWPPMVCPESQTYLPKR